MPTQDTKFSFVHGWVLRHRRVMVGNTVVTLCTTYFNIQQLCFSPHIVLDYFISFHLTLFVYLSGIKRLMFLSSRTVLIMR